jgi:hypothetical protein
MSTGCELYVAEGGRAPLVAPLFTVVQNASWDRIRAGLDSSNGMPVPAFTGPCARRARARSVRTTREPPLSVRPTPNALSLAFVLLCAASAAAATTGTPAGSAAATTTPPPAPAKPSGAAGTRQALVIEGDDHLFMIAAPPGWVLDDTAGMGSRIRCVFYPKGEKWTSAATVMYVNPLHGFGVKTRTVTTLMAEDEQAFRKRAPRGTVTDAGTLATSEKGNVARVRYFSDDGGAPHEAVAYVPDRDLVMLLVLSSHTPQGFQQALAAYKQLVESYAYVGSNRGLGN